MARGKPTIQEIPTQVFSFIGRSILVVHGITNDIAFLFAAAKKHSIATTLGSQPYLDTLRMARLYGESPTNSMQTPRKLFNISEEGAHRAMNDAVVNVEVFKYLADRFKTTEQLLEILKNPILL